MTATVLAISAAYVVIGVLLLALGLTARLAWWVKAAAIVVTSVFFLEVFFATKGLLGLAPHGTTAAAVPAVVGAGGRARSQELQSGRDLSLDRGGGREQRSGWRAALVPLAVFAPARRPRRQGARRNHERQAPAGPGRRPRRRRGSEGGQIRSAAIRSRVDPGLTTVDLDQFRLLQQAQRVEFSPMPVPTLPPKPWSACPEK